MPNVTIFIAEDSMPPDSVLAPLTARCAELCATVLRAAPSNIHILYVGARHGAGHPAFVDVRYRLEPFRTPAVMARFMSGIDDAIRQLLGVTARIRCFGYAANCIHAKH